MKWMTQELRAAIIEKGQPRKASPPEKRFGRGQIRILVLLALITLGILGALSVLLTRQERPPAPIVAEPAAVGKLELQVAREKAQSWAVGWRPDAQLVGADAQWQLTDGDRTALPLASWSFSFYSPAAGQVRIVTIDQAGTQPVRQAPVGKAPVPVTADWSLTADDLLLTFLAHGGHAFIREHARVSLHFRLSAQDGERPIWYLSAIAPEARQSFTVSVDALSRQIVRTS